MSEHHSKSRREPLVVVKTDPFNAEAPLSALREKLTPTEQFYVRSNFVVPQIAPGEWRLSVGGTVQKPLVLTLADLRALPSRSLTATIECAGNSRTGFVPLPQGEPWTSGAISTARWRGAALRDVLAAAGLDGSVVEVVFEGADGGSREGQDAQLTFARSLPLEKALDPATLLAYELNNEPLPTEHGGPVRLLVPGWYGMASVKWVVRIEALDQPFRGYFQAERYVLEQQGELEKEPVREMRVKSLITSPLPGDVLTAGQHLITGVAWSGTSAIERVEVSVESENDWRPAMLVGAAVPYTWRQWQLEWRPPRPGRYVVRARATDEQGNTQPDIAAWNRLGYANNSIHSVICEVRE